MEGIFYARGGDIRPAKIPSFSLVHVYPFLAQLYRLPIDKAVDGRADVLARIIKNQ